MAHIVADQKPQHIACCDKNRFVTEVLCEDSVCHTCGHKGELRGALPRVTDRNQFAALHHSVFVFFTGPGTLPPAQNPKEVHFKDPQRLLHGRAFGKSLQGPRIGVKKRWLWVRRFREL